MPANSSSKLLIINGPNLNMLGVREPHIYGSMTLQDVKILCVEKAALLGFTVDFRQSNHEGEIVTWIQDERDAIAGLIINAGAYTHTSIAIHDALKILTVPIVEVHVSDPAARETFRHFSYIEPVAAACIKGRGPVGYVEAVEAVAQMVNKS